MKTLNVLFLLAVVLSVVTAHWHDESPCEWYGSKYSDFGFSEYIEYIAASVALYSGGAVASAANGAVLPQFADMIRNKVMVKSIFDLIAKYTNYGCYCGLGGSGTPVDDLDRCCQVHDECYGKVQVDLNCSSWFGDMAVPYIKRYDYAYDNGTVICLHSNDRCQMVLCECDRAAAECFAKAPYNRRNKNLDLSRCK